MERLIDLVAKKDNLKTAWYGIKHRPDSRGFDGVTISYFQQKLTENIDKIHDELLSGKYKFTPLKGVAVLKPGTVKKYRPLKVPAVRDRVVQKAIELAINPHIKKVYQIDNPFSFAYIEEKKVEDAIMRVKELYESGRYWVYNADIAKFFDTIDLGILLNNHIYPCLPDDSLHKIINQALTIELGNGPALKAMGVYDEFPKPGDGIPQGGTLSPLFANVYLNPLDMAMIKEGFQMVRYADDLVVLCKSQKEARRADELTRKIVEGDLKLKIHPTVFGGYKSSVKSSYIAPVSGLEFIGIKFRGKQIFPGEKQFQKVTAKIREQARPSQGPELIKKLNYLKSRVDIWGANYHYTDVDKKKYDFLDQELFGCVNRIFLNCGYKLVRKGRPQDILSKLGIRTFTQSLDKYKNATKDKRAKDKATEKVPSLILPNQSSVA